MKTKGSGTINTRLNASLLVVSGVLIVAGGFLPGLQSLVTADQYDNQIQALQQQNSQAQAAANNLQPQIDSYQSEVNALQSEIASLQQNINDNEAQQAVLQQKIAANQAEIDQERAFLASDLKAMYVDGTPTTLEVLATSKNLSDFVDKQEYRTTVQNKLQTTLKKIAELQKQLQSQKTQLEDLLSQLQTQQTQLNADEQQQASLLAMTQNEQNAYTSQIKANNAQIAKLQSEQLAAYNKLTGGGKFTAGSYGTFQFRNLTPEYSCGGGYDYCWAGFDQSVSDTWGLGLARECVHYAADRAAKGLNLAPYLGRYWGAGNAENWANNLSGAYPVNHDPSGGHVVAVVAWPGGGGHAMYVESVLGDGWVHVSQMNWDVRGHYSEMDIKASGVLFVHFP